MPDDEYSILTKVREWGLEAHNTRCSDCPMEKYVTDCNNIDGNCPMSLVEKAYKRVAEYIEHGRIRQRKKV